MFHCEIFPLTMVPQQFVSVCVSVTSLAEFFHTSHPIKKSMTLPINISNKKWASPKGETISPSPKFLVLENIGEDSLFPEKKGTLSETNSSPLQIGLPEINTFNVVTSNHPFLGAFALSFSFECQISVVGEPRFPATNQPS